MSAADILEALRRVPEHACSGESLSQELGVSRAAIWKQIEGLRKRGYEIEGTPGGGYHLTAAPDRLYPEEIHRGLGTRWLARDLMHFESTDSTNRVAFEQASQGAPHGTTVVAEQQTAGRGRLGRSFFSPAHQNLYTSIVLRPELSIAQAPTLILTSAIAVAEAVDATLNSDRREGDAPASTHAVEIKWPNDVLIDGLKTSGILMEMSAEATRVAFVILGIGVNLNVEREALPEEFREQATSLRSQAYGVGGPLIDRVAFARRLYVTLEDVLDIHAANGFDALRPRFEAFFRMPGREITVTGMNGELRKGIARGLAEDGALEMETIDGRIERVVAGDVTLSPQTPPASLDMLLGASSRGEASS